MAKNTERFTVYLTEGERVALRLLARHLCVSESGVFKILLRDKTNLSLPDRYQYQLETFNPIRESRVVSTGRKSRPDLGESER